MKRVIDYVVRYKKKKRRFIKILVPVYEEMGPGCGVLKNSKKRGKSDTC